MDVGREFRSDINGMRAWAVMAVVLYHFGVPGISGGFAGVDVFFVISGYLMCGIISSGLDRGDFSIWRFYLARARRIFPALIALCLAVLAVGWFLLMPEEYKDLGKHARESLTFSSNLRYFEEAGYFDVASREKWLLHTWSLSVEWQFYLLLPLLMLALSRFLPGRRALVWVLALLFVGSLALCLWRTAVAPTEAFYMIQARAWEMLAGALVFLVGRQNWSEGLRKALEGIGFALILTCLLLIDQQNVWPGGWAVLPVLGAALILLAARERSAWTGSYLAQWLGTRSYSIYLWHWPLVVALAYVERSTDPLWVVAAIALSLLLGQLSYWGVETPSRRALSRMSPKAAGLALVLILALVATLAQQVRRSGFPDRLPEAVGRIEAERENFNPRLEECLDPSKSCIYGQEPIRAVLIGDSHADAVVTALQAALPDGKGGVLFRGGSGCLIAFDSKAEVKRGYCDQLNVDIRKEHASYPPGVPIVMMGRTSEYVNGGVAESKRVDFAFASGGDVYGPEYLAAFGEHYTRTMCELASKHPLYIVRPTPEMGVDVPTLIGRSMLLGRDRQVSLPLDAYRKRHAFVWALQDEVAHKCGAKLLDPLPYLCSGDACGTLHDGLPIYRDTDHFTETGSRLLLPMFKKIFSDNR